MQNIQDSESGVTVVAESEYIEFEDEALKSIYDAGKLLPPAQRHSWTRHEVPEKQPLLL